MTGWQEASPDGRYRWALGRRWAAAAEPDEVLFVMLNPSTADGERDDQTVRRCVRFARDWGYGGLLVGNLFAWRATVPTDLLLAEDPVGRLCDSWLDALSGRAALTVAAWGAHPLARDRAARALELLEEAALRGPVSHLGLNRDGSPRHPLRLSRLTLPERWER